MLVKSKLFNDFNKNYIYIILSYGFFLGWTISFPYNGPLFEYLCSWCNYKPGHYILAYMGIPVIFLVIFGFVKKNELYPKKLIFYSVISCFISNLLLMMGVTYWYPIFIIMGLSSVIFVIGWSYFFTVSVSYKDKIKVMGLTIVFGNIILYVVNVIINLGFELYIVNISLIMLTAALLSASFLDFEKSYDFTFLTDKSIGSLILLICGVIFFLNLNDGLNYSFIDPLFESMNSKNIFFKKLPYILAIILLVVYSDKIHKFSIFYIALFLVGMSNVAFMVLGINETSFLLKETMMQSGLGIGDLFAWTIIGYIGHIYGRPYKIISFGLASLLASTFAGNVLGRMFIDSPKGDIYIMSLSLTSVFIVLLILPELLSSIDRDIVKVKEEAKFSTKLKSLTERETEVYKLIMKNYKNKDIAEKLYISDNTLKTHLRNIYSKLNVAGKKELQTKQDT